jgi:DNA-binding response OmpR family regulator
MRLLLIEDERKLSEALSHILKVNGYLVDTALDGEIGFELATNGIYDIVVLDRMLPHRDGISLLKDFRRLGFATPVLLLTAKDAPKDRVEGLDAGADDYLVKPFFTNELLARLRALTRRKSKDIFGTTITVAGIELTPLKGKVIKGSEIVQLTPKESMLLELLMHNVGQVLTKEMIMEKIWGYNSETEIANVDLYIHYLRKKLKIPNIKTVRGVGYYFQGDQNVS